MQRAWDDFITDFKISTRAHIRTKQGIVASTRTPISIRMWSCRHPELFSEYDLLGTYVETPLLIVNFEGEGSLAKIHWQQQQSPMKKKKKKKET